MENSFNLEIISPVVTVFSGEVNSVTVPGTSGSFQVLKNHAALVSSVEVGMVKINKGSEVIEYSTSGGLFEVKNNKAILLAESIESKEEIDLERARQSKARAEQILKIAEAREDEKLEAREALQRAVNRIKLAERKN
ncbi:MAG TPA: ATP synthase F1 subunit epsilon [Ignavibacteria bacterium]|nr:ATP synthase F1 subunit epsilon [Ignavibacteria bacterium]HMR41075.1 ATP synthase F1 subunit epsilon [Ignavibacteria bacterium]